MTLAFPVLRVRFPEARPYLRTSQSIRKGKQNMSEFKAFSEMTHTSYCGRFTQLNEFLLMRQLPMINAGDERRAQLDSVEKVQAYAKEMRETFIEKLGGVPERECPLNPQITSVRDMGNYTQEAVIFNSRKGVYVTGTMYIPKGHFRQRCI